jgi:hypothetical protein
MNLFCTHLKQFRTPKTLTWISVIAFSLACSMSANAQPIQIVNLLELSGAGATVGANMKNGVELAIKEINASGGILGRKIEITTMDTQTNPGVAKGLAQKAVDMDAYAVIGPIYSGSIAVSMAETRRAEIPNFTGAAAASVTQQGNPYIFRTNFTQSSSMPKVTKYIKEQFKFYAVGTKVSGISKSSIKNIVLFLPDLLEQKMIANTLNSIDDELQVLETKKNKSIALKQGMMQELLTGKTRLI